jgi:hypothetical protein
MAKIAVDFDRTYTSDPHLWLAFMLDAKFAGHDVFIVTARSGQSDRCEMLDDIEFRHDFPVYYTNGVAKRWWCLHNGPGVVDIWIDDKPEAILENSNATPEWLEEWRTTREF